MNLDSVINRLKDEVPALKIVGGAAQFDLAEAALTTWPAAFVLPAAEQGGENMYLSQGIEQNVTCLFAIAIAVRNLADARGKAALGDALTPIRIPIRAAIINWKPEGDDEADDYQTCEYDSGSLTAIGNGTLWWTDTYRTAFTLRRLN